MARYIDTITAQHFKDYFDRGFNYAPASAPDDPQYIRDSDIENALEQAGVNFNESLWDDDSQRKLAFLFLAAHYLCMDMKMQQAGINSTSQFMIAAKSVGDVSASYAIPQTFLNSPIYSYYTTTQFGMKYISLVYARTIGRVSVIFGATTTR